MSDLPTPLPLFVTSLYIEPQRSVTASSFSSSSSSKPAIIIRRHAPAKPHLRTRVADDIVDEAGPSTPPPAREPSQEYRTTSPQPSCDHGSSAELTPLRQLLRPPPMPGVDAWGIPSEPDTPCDETIKVRISRSAGVCRAPGLLCSPRGIGEDYFFSGAEARLAQPTALQ